MLENQDINVLVGHPDTRAELTISISLEPISSVGRTGGLPRVGCCRGQLADTKMHTFNEKCATNAYLWAENTLGG